MKAVAVIPARYDSSRFPGKPLAEMGTKTIIRHVYENAVNSGLFYQVIVGTDDQRIFEEVEAFGGRVVLTGRNHQSGTDRIAEVCRNYPACHNADIIVNIQGDEPFISRQPLEKILAAFADDEVQVASLMCKTKQEDDPNIVKVVCDKNNFAIYFSRSVIPFDRDKSRDFEYFKHIGIYAFRKEMLFHFVDLPIGRLEKIEKLEQLRLLENGIRIKMVETDYQGIGIDTPEDLEKARKLFKSAC